MFSHFSMCPSFSYNFPFTVFHLALDDINLNIRLVSCYLVHVMGIYIIIFFPLFAGCDQLTCTAVTALRFTALCGFTQLNSARCKQMFRIYFTLTV